MAELEYYKDNIDVKDAFEIKDVNINKGAIYKGQRKQSNVQKSEKDKVIPLAAAVVGTENTGIPLPTGEPMENAWTGVDVQEMYLDSKPTCYLILGLPGCGAYKLGEALSKKLKCIHLCPQTILNDEIAQASSTGKCLDFNMKHSKILTCDILEKILKMKLESPVIKHRGYIISGFPLVTTSSDSKYLFRALYGEESLAVIEQILFDLIYNLNRKKPKKSKNLDTLSATQSSNQDVMDEGDVEEEEQTPEIPEEEDVKVELPKFILDACHDIIVPTKTRFQYQKVILLHQLNMLFSLKVPPDVIIYVDCPDKDMVKLKSYKYIDYVTNNFDIDLSTPISPEETRWPIKYISNDPIYRHASHLMNIKYTCRQPFNFERNSKKQISNFRENIEEFIKEKVKEYDLRYIIKADARSTLPQMVHDISERLLVLPVRPVRVPQPLTLDEPPEDLEEFWRYIETYNPIKSGVISFKRRASLWFNRCPVELKNRRSVRGRPKFAVMFCKYVYLPANLDNMISFCRNPRPYLQLKYLRPTCRIIVIGSKLSGKTMICDCLSWLFDTPILDYQSFLVSRKQKKYDMYEKTILSEIISIIEDARYNIWQNKESERLSNIDDWCKSVEPILKKYIPLLKQYITITSKGAGNVEVEEIIDKEFLKKFTNIKNQLSFLPILNNLDQCIQALSTDVLSKYAPANLLTPTESPKLPVLGDADVTQAIADYIVANDLQQEIEPTTEEIMNKIIEYLNEIDKERETKSKTGKKYGKYIIDGFPSDTSYWDILIDNKLLPDYTISLTENREIEPELMEYYKTIHRASKQSCERYVLADDPLIKIMLNTKPPPTPRIDLDIKVVLNDCVENVFVDDSLEITKNVDAPLWDTFAEELEQIKQDRDVIQARMEEHNKCIIDVTLEDKSDIEVVEEVLLNLRKGYFLTCVPNEDVVDDDDNDNEPTKNLSTYNNPLELCETGTFCPVAFYKHGVLWEGNPELSIKFDNKLHFFCKEEYSELFQRDVTKYQAYNNPFKTIPPLRICVVGPVGVGKSTVSKSIAKELGLLHIDFYEIVNDNLLPKHFKKVGRKYENSFTDASLADEVDIFIDEESENGFDVLGNESRLRSMLFNYFERGTPMPPPLIQKLIKKLWFQDPFVNIGFILDGYPKVPTDVEDMTSCFCIPDLVIEIEGNADISLKRLTPIMLKNWKIQLSEVKDVARQKLELEKQDWMHFITKNVIAIIIYNEIIDNIHGAESEANNLFVESTIIDAHPSGSRNVDADLFNTYNKMIKEFPEPVDQNQWEKVDDVREKLDERLQTLYEVEDENIQSLKESLTENRIKLTSVNGTKSLSKIIRTTLSKLTNLRNRSESFFEQTIILDPTIANILLQEGFCFLSKFYRMCPVYIFENPNVIQNNFNCSKQKNEIHCVIHRSYVYFVGGKRNVIKFRSNPLKYVSCSNILKFVEFPLTISVIGAPKSGKSELSAKLAKRFGLLYLSRGSVLRKLLELMHWTHLADKVKFLLTSGKNIENESIVNTVRASTINHRFVSNGFVLDGFPETAPEAIELMKYGLYPKIVFDLNADIETILERSQKEVNYDILKYRPPYCRPLIEYKYNNWQKNKICLRDWVNHDIQNIYPLDGNKSKWQCSHDAIKVIDSFVPELHHYLLNVNTKAVPAYVMGISNNTFKERMSNFKKMCPVCYRLNILKSKDQPADKKGVLQYKNKFYWVCSDHLNIVVKFPKMYLEMQKVEIPEMPAVVKTIAMFLVYENGVCMVCYAENLPSQKIVRGTNKFAASYNGKTYLFCGEKCLKHFLKKPHLYYDITVFKGELTFPPISLKRLPIIGYLEQTVGDLITEACCSVNVLRPKYPGLSFQISALLYIALYLKTHNPRIDNAALALYLKVAGVYEARCKLIKNVGLFLRSMDNPFAKYPKCCKEKCEADRKNISIRSSDTTLEQLSLIHGDIIN